MAREQTLLEQEEQPHEVLDPANVTDEMIELCPNLSIGAHLVSWRLQTPAQRRPSPAFSGSAGPVSDA